MWRRGAALGAVGALVLLCVLGCARAVSGTPAAAPGQVSTAPSSSSAPVAGNPLIPGWQPVLSRKRSSVFDVPASWSVKPDTTTIGYEVGKDIIAGSGSAVFKEGFCPGQSNSQRGLAVLTTSQVPDLAAAAAESAKKWAELGYRGSAEKTPTVVAQPPVPLRTIKGLDGMAAKVTAKPIGPIGACDTPTGIVRTLAVAGTGMTVVLVVLIDVDVPDAAPETDVDQMFSTLRKAS